MDDDGLDIKNWGYYEPPSFKQHLGLQLMSPVGDHRDTKPLFSTRENPVMINPNAPMYYHQPPIPMNYMRDSWIQRERLLHMLPGNPNFSHMPDTSASNSINMMQPIDSPKDQGMIVEENTTGGGGSCDDAGGSSAPKKRSATTVKNPRVKKPKKLKENGNATGSRSKVVKRSMDMVINGIDMDISGLPIPVCSCTGAPQQCYRWGLGGWQSACCTTTISMYPLPMSTKRRGARIAGRKMSQGAFKKVLEKLISEGYSFDTAIDLRTHWAKHGTNKFVTIR
ncbi:protein BASIC PENTACYSTEINE1-like [Rutidosis leptorrhynchoides]|uniref:protein BASIC PENTACYSTEINE1-like n=1 Tax=Rutidosis leptorrhynchoides TaxID=125765 RepID=UPI003A9A5CF3